MGMKVFLTGASGFVGYHLLTRLLEQGHDVISYDINPPIHQDFLSRQMSTITGDLTSGDGLDQIEWENVDAVIHLAAAGVKASRRIWSDCISVNILGTEQLLNAISQVSEQPLLIYPRTLYEDYLSKIPSLENNPYIVTKTSATKIVELWAKNTSNARVVFGTVFQTYGSGDDPGNILPYTVSCLQNGVAAKLGSGKGLRDWIYIDDLVDAFMRSLEVKGKNIQYFDFGTGQLTSIKEVVQTLAKLLGKPLSLLDFNHELDRGDISLKAKARNFLPGWEPHFSLDKGLPRFLDSLG